MARPALFQLLRDGLADFVAHETEPAKAKLVPAAKHVGVGPIFVAAIVTSLLHSLWMLVIVLALILSWLTNLTGLNTVDYLALGFLVAALLSIGIAVLLIFVARGRFRKIKAPTTIIEEARAIFVALTDAATGQLTEVAVKEELSFPEVS